jgi:hypothetical protein
LLIVLLVTYSMLTSHGAIGRIFSIPSWSLSSTVPLRNHLYSSLTATIYRIAVGGYLCHFP